MQPLSQIKNRQKLIFKIIGIIFFAIGPIVFAGVNVLNGYNQIRLLQVLVAALCLVIGGLLIGAGEYRATQSMKATVRQVLKWEAIAVAGGTAFYVAVWIVLIVIVLIIIGSSNIP
ncbi:MAG TPA: hypothetical protein VMR75_02375 [Candidatus Saccharimonadales bacterium]|nr:hypothetical protein [Candidatus Saccharimonadales bacterium]